MYFTICLRKNVYKKRTYMRVQMLGRIEKNFAWPFVYIRINI